MKLRFLYALTGGLAGLLLGGLVAFWVIAAGAGISWLFLYGDDTWPAATAWVLPALGLLAGLVVLCGLVALGFFYGRRQEPPTDRKRAYRQAYGLLGLALFLVVAAVAGLAWQDRKANDARALSAAREAAFQTLLAQRQRISAADFNAAAQPEMISLLLSTEGQAAGRYRLGWRIDYSLYNAILLEGTRDLSLEHGTNEIDLDLDQNLIARSYRKAVLQGSPAAVLVDQTFEGELWLEPLLSSEQTARIPPREIQNLSLGYSELRDHRKITVPVKFKIMASGEVTF